MNTRSSRGAAKSSGRRARKAASRARRTKFDASEYVRIVPLYAGKPSMTLRDLVRGDRGDPFEGLLAPVVRSAKLTYRGGALLESVEVFAIFWGKQWAASPSAKTLIAKINQFFADILGSALIDQLAEYNVSGKKIGHGRFTGSKVIAANAPTSSVSDSQIRTRLAQWIRGAIVPKNNKNSLYYVYLDPAIVSVMGGSKSCQNYCGYHNNVGTVYYAVMPYPGCTGCLGSVSAIDALTATSSHELCEAITDPVPGQGWYDDTNGEIGDICAWTFKRVLGWNVQLEWSNAQNKCV